MARCTKEVAFATHEQLLDAAERVFFEQGVSRTSLQDIAQAAGVSRGAIYWHFKNKADLFNAMMARITLPMETTLQCIGADGGRDPLEALQHAILDAIRKIASDERTRRVFEVATLKVEYVDELLAVKERQLQTQTEVVQRMSLSLQDASSRRAVGLPISALAAAQGLHALVVGLIHTWLLAPQAFALVDVTEASMRAYLAGLGLTARSGGGQPLMPIP